MKILSTIGKLQNRAADVVDFTVLGYLEWRLSADRGELLKRAILPLTLNSAKTRADSCFLYQILASFAVLIYLRV